MTSLPNSDIRVWRYISADTQIFKQPTCCSKRRRAVSKGGGGGTQNVDLRVQDEINKDFVFFLCTVSHVISPVGSIFTAQLIRFTLYTLNKSQTAVSIKNGTDKKPTDTDVSTSVASGRRSDAALCLM